MTKGSDIAGCVIAGIGLLSALAAILTYFAAVQDKRNAADVGFICTNERRMGMFRAVRGRFWGSAHLVSVPSMTGLLRAADANVWTSALIEGLDGNLNDEVCWKTIYEAFFIQLAWRKEPTPETWSISEIMKRASSSDLALQFKHPIAYYKSSLDMEAQQARELSHWHQILSWAKAISLSVLEIFSCSRRNPYHAHQDRRIFYQKLTGAQHSPLSDCIKPLRKLAPINDLYPLDGRWSIWKRNLCPIWMLEDRPCITIYRDQLEAFCLAFGINLTPQNGGFRGAGAFGLTMNIVSDQSLLKVGLRQTRRLPSLRSCKGSGYSLLYARSMACGCLPFAQTPSWVKSIVVTPGILNSIRQGGSINDANEVTNYPGARYLDTLAGQYNNDFYFTPGGPIAAPPGQLYGKIRVNLGAGLSTHCSWPEAVAGIAFGGLVPQAALYLVEAVRFTVIGTGTLAMTPLELLNQIERFIDKVDEWEPDLELFGLWVPRRRETTRDPVNAIHIAPPIDIAQAAATFSRYSTLLEWLVATASSNAALTDPVGDVYRRVCGILDSQYEGIFNGAASDAISLPNLILGKAGVTVNICADIARLLILAWTYIVNLVQWADTELDPLFLSHASHHSNNPVTLHPMDEPIDKPGALGF